MFRKLREQGDGKSGDSAVATPAPEANPSEQAPVADSGAKEPTVTELQEQITGLKKTMGDQGNEIGEYKKTAALNKQQMDTDAAFMGQLKTNPAETLKSLGVAAGLTVTTPSAELTTTGDQAADQAAQTDAIVKKALAEHMGPVNVMMSTVQESHLATKYGESWDTLAGVRNSNLIRLQSNQIPMSEVAHMVSEYERMPQHLEAAELRGREKYRAELEKKAGGHLPDGTGQEPHTVPESEQTPTHAAAKLAQSW